MLNKYLIGFLILTGLSSCRFNSDVNLVIKEVEPLNMVMLADEDGDYSPYLKICNQGTAPVSLKNYALLKNTSRKNLFTFPNIQVAVDSCVVVFLSGKYRDYNKLYWQNLLYGKGKKPWHFEENIKMGREPRQLIAAIELSNEAIIHLDGRFIINDVVVTEKHKIIPISKENLLVKIQLEGQTLMQYIGNGKVKIDLENNMPSNFPTNLYIGYKLGETNTNIPKWLAPKNFQLHTNFTLKPGLDELSFADSSGNLLTRFKMPDISQSKAYKAIDRLPTPITVHEKGLRQYTLNIIPQWLFDEKNGILTMGENASLAEPYFGANFWDDNLVPAFLFQSGNINGQSIALKVHGNYSRLFEQKSISYKPLRWGNNITKIFRNAGQDNQSAHLRNVLVNNIAGIDSFSQLVLVYAAKQSLGCFHLQTKLNEQFLAEKYNIPSNTINLLEGGIAYSVSGSSEDLLHLIKQINEGTISPTDLKLHFDIDNLIEHFAINIFIGNADWPHNNIRFWNSPVTNFKWTYELYDCDISLGLNMQYSSSENDLRRVVLAKGNYHSLIFRTLLQDAEFKSFFIKRYTELLEGKLSYAETSKKLSHLKNQMEPYMIEHFKTWPDSSYSYKIWEEEVAKVDVYLKSRPYFAKRHLEQF